MADTTVQIRSVPIRTPVFDPQGNLARPWVVYLENSLDSAGTVALIEDAIANAGLGEGVAAYAW